MTSHQTRRLLRIRNQHSKRGFSLVEIILALLVVTIGLLAVLSLMSGGLDLNSGAIDDGHASMFARQVFDGYRAEFARDPTSWDDADKVVLPVVGPEIWNTNAHDIYVYGDGNIYTHVYEHDSAAAVEETALRYRLTFDELPPPVVGKPVRIKSATLEIWPRRFGATLPAQAKAFYTEFYRFGL